MFLSWLICVILHITSVSSRIREECWLQSLVANTQVDTMIEFSLCVLQLNYVLDFWINWICCPRVINLFGLKWNIPKMSHSESLVECKKSDQRDTTRNLTPLAQIIKKNESQADLRSVNLHSMGLLLSLLFVYNGEKILDFKFSSNWVMQADHFSLEDQPSLF